MSQKKETGVLRRSVEAVVESAATRGVNVTADELFKLVRTHSAGAAAASIATGVLPGAGATLSVIANTGFVWSLYYRICVKLGINVKKELLKALGSAFITNASANVVSLIITSTVLSFIPGLGTVGAATVCGLVGYGITYYSGIIFMQLLVRVFKTGGQLENMSAEELKQQMADLTKEVRYDSIKEEVKTAFKERKQDGGAEPIAEAQESAAPIVPKHTYWLHVGVDFGSTNSVMAWRLFQWSHEDGWQIDKQNNQENNIVRCPTMLVYKADNPAHPNVPEDGGEGIAGQRAEELANDSQLPAVAQTNFKPIFYDAKPDSAEEQQARKFMGAFMRHLYQLYQNEVLARLPGQVRDNLSITVHFSTPVRAEKRHRDCMVCLAKEAGFVDNGEDQFIDTSRNEAECVMNLAVDLNRGQIEQLIAKSHAKAALNLLFIDIGGSTTDIELIKQEMHISGKSTQVLAMWPKGKVQHMLGGCEVDRAILDYLLKNECLIPKYAEECWAHGTGKTLFRKFKENNNEVLRKGGEIASLGTIRSACGDPDEEERPRKKYSDCKITREIYEQQICAHYIDSMCNAIRDVMKEQIGEEEVDAVFLTGAGSKLYFIRDILLGKLGKAPLHLEQLQKNESLLFDHFNDPAACCALGAISNIM